MDHTELRRTGKFLLFSCSAGLIELGSFALFNEVFHWPHWAAYLTALVLSVLTLAAAVVISTMSRRTWRQTAWSSCVVMVITSKQISRYSWVKTPGFVIF